MSERARCACNETDTRGVVQYKLTRKRYLVQEQNRVWVNSECTQYTDIDIRNTSCKRTALSQCNLNQQNRTKRTWRFSVKQFRRRQEDFIVRQRDEQWKERGATENRMMKRI